MLNAKLDSRLARGRLAGQETSVDGIDFFNAAGLETPRAHRIHRPRGHARGFWLLAAIVVVTFAAVVLLDHAGIHLPVDDGLLAGPLG